MQFSIPFTGYSVREHLEGHEACVFSDPYETGLHVYSAPLWLNTWGKALF